MNEVISRSHRLEKFRRCEIHTLKCFTTRPASPFRFIGSSISPSYALRIGKCLRAFLAANQPAEQLGTLLESERESGAARVASALRKKCRRVVGVKVMSSRIEVANKATAAGLNRPRFLDVKELAEMLRLKTRTIYDMVSEGRIPYRKAGDRTIFLLDEILDWTKPDRER